MFAYFTHICDEAMARKTIVGERDSKRNGLIDSVNNAASRKVLFELVRRPQLVESRLKWHPLLNVSHALVMLITKTTFRNAWLVLIMLKTV